MRNLIQITQITSKGCGGNGAWIDNPHNFPISNRDEWLGFQLGGGRKSSHRTRKRLVSKVRRIKRKSHNKTKHGRIKHKKTKKIN